MARRVQVGSPTWKQRIEAFRYVPPFLKLVWQTSRFHTMTMVVLRLVRSFVPVSTLWVGKLIIDTVVALRGGSGEIVVLWKLVALEICIVVVGEVLARVSALVESLLGDLFSNYTSIRLLEHAATLDLYQFEDPAFYDQLERARRQTTSRIGLLAQLLSMGQDAVTLGSLGVALLIFNPFLPALLVLAVIPAFLGETHFASLEYSLLFRYTPERRRLDYIRYIGASDETVKEVQLFGLARWLVDRYRVISRRFYDENKKLSIRKSIVSTALSFIGTAGYYAAYVVILLRTIAGALSLGSLTFLAGSFARSRDLIHDLLFGASDIYEQCLYLKDLFGFFEMKPSIISKPDAPQVPNPIRYGFEFENVGFRYPGNEQWAVRNASFKLRPGERIALVGENGSGKTTLTKLLARLYDPTEGSILLDGIDLREYDLRSLRNAIGVIFQDYVEYDLRFDENIGVGEIGKVGEYLDAHDDMNLHGRIGHEKNDGQNGDVPESIRTAADKSLASTLLNRFSDGFRQMLGRRFDRGIDLSGGEWQKIALARAYMREAEVLILDEPTSSLDARAEYEVFTRFTELAAGRMAVIILHRFSTVRMAQRIIVLHQGKIVEEGTHEELLKKEGLYAELFKLQAEGYK